MESRTERMEQENRVLKMELETLKLKVKSLIEENKGLKAASVSIQARAEQEEEFISNTLLKRIQILKKEKETLALNYEQEEECLTNDLSRQLNQLRAEKMELEMTLEKEQEALVTRLMKKIEKLEGETNQKQMNLDQLRREKIELENTLEQEQEALVNKLWKRMDKLENEKRLLQHKLEELNKAANSDQSVSSLDSFASPNAPSECNNDNQQSSNVEASGSQLSAQQLSFHVHSLRGEVNKLKKQLQLAEKEKIEKLAKFEREEREQREQNLRLQRKLQIEMERREQLCRHLSESESSLEMDEERHFNEQFQVCKSRSSSSPVPPLIGSFPTSSPLIPTATHIPLQQRPISPAASSLATCPNCGFALPILTPTTSPVIAFKPKDPTKLMKHC